MCVYKTKMALTINTKAKVICVLHLVASTPAIVSGTP